MKKSLTAAALMAFLASVAVAADQPGASPGPGTRYASDAYPGFDNGDDEMAPERKEPKWFSCINGPNRDNAKDQLAYCRELLADGNWSRAAKHLDALVREWPTADEAPVAQQFLAETCRDKLLDYEDAFKAYLYLADFYSLQCDYEKVTDLMYEAAKLMRQEGKTIVFFRFDNTVDVRRAFEACVLRAPGAKWVRQAMLTIGELREDEGKYAQAVKVYENLVNLHGDSREAKVAILREAHVRMLMLREHGYNRDRCRDTIDFMKMALTNCSVEDVDQIKEFLAEAVALTEDEAYRATKFYDSRTRTSRSAINAYENFLSEYPNSAHAEEIKERLMKLKEEGK